MVKKIISMAIVLGLALILILPQDLLAGTTGKISGKIINEETGEVLPGVAVSIVGTKMGALTDENGEFYIINVPPGNYTLKAELIGYAPVEVTNVDVSVDLTSYIDYSLSRKALELGKTIVVTAERPLVIKDKTASLKVVEAEEIQNLPTRGYEDIVGLQAGVVRFRDNANTRQRGGHQTAANSMQLNIRGGRSSEVAYYVDGFSQQDPLSGVSTTNINNNALAEVEISTGGFPAEYGWAASGVINATTKEGTAEFAGSVEAITDNVLSDNYDYNNYSVDIGGPIPFLEEAMSGSSFFLSGERRWQGDRQPSSIIDDPLPHNSLGGWSGQGKLSLKFNDNMNLKIGGMYSFDNWKEYRHNYYFDIEHSPKYEDENYSMYAKWTHTLNPETFYSTSVSYFVTKRIRGDGVHFDDLEMYKRPNGQPSFDATGLFYSWDDINGETETIFDYVIDTTLIDSIETEPDEWEYIYDYDTTTDRMYILAGDEGHVWDDLYKRKSSYIGIDADITSQITPNHLMKLGLDFQRHTLRYYRHLFPTNPTSQDIDRYGYDEYGNETDDLDWRNEAKHPITLAFYGQDKFEWQDLVVNAGLRWDYFDSKALRVKNLQYPFDPEGGTNIVLDRTDLEDSKAETRLSPRLGVAFPISDKTVFHVSYGLFFQRPDLQNLYVGYDYYEYKVNSGGYFYPFGNPNLEPEKTTAYEFGIDHQLGDNTAFQVTAFYKDVQNLTQVATFPAQPKAYSIYFNQDFGTIKGMDFSLKMRRMHNISLDLAYTLSWANGTGSFAGTQQNIAWVSSEVPVQTAPLVFDMRHKFTGIVDIRTGRGEGPMLGNIYPLENAGVNFVFDLSSGTPYSPVRLDADPITLYSVSYTPAAPVNSRYSDWKFRIDMKASKTFHIGRANLDVYVWVLNLLDGDNVLAVYESSGSAESTYWLTTESGENWMDTYNTASDASGLTGYEKYVLKEKDPGNYDIPRQVRFGIRMSF
nr:TonB-dependent receptor [candidate division Zixibacteria bacterium]